MGVAEHTTLDCSKQLHNLCFQGGIPRWLFPELLIMHNFKNKHLKVKINLLEDFSY